MKNYYTIKTRDGYNVVEELETFKAYQLTIPVAMEMLKEAMQDARFDRDGQIKIEVIIDRYEED